MSFNIFDVSVLGLLAVFMAISMMRGAMREVISLVGLLAGVLAARWFHGAVADWISPLISHDDYARMIAYGALLVAGLLAGSLIGGFTTSLRRIQPGLISRLLGGMVGLAKGLVVCLALIWIVENYIPGLRDEMSDSWSAGHLNTLLDQLGDFPLI